MASLLADAGPAIEHPAIAELRSMAFRGLDRMYDPEAGQFVFCLRKSDGGILREGRSDRYTAITAIGLAGEEPGRVRALLAGDSLRELVVRLISRVEISQNLGDLAITAWAAALTGCAADKIWQRIVAFRPEVDTLPTVEVAWVLSAASVERSTLSSALAERVALRLRRAFSPLSRLFPHRLEEAPSSVRRHVSCFADLVYPTLALAQYGEAYHDREAVACASLCADNMCRLQGPAGQWWWHFDYRTGRVLERYPVYAVHQDAMAPMALFAAARAAGTTHDADVQRGLGWLNRVPELDGRSLIDRENDLIWRKVARREPAKLSRYLQAAASRVSPNLRAPALDRIFPPDAVDYETRPYHLGWILFAWPSTRAVAWTGDGPHA